jgi:hypothetical protein
MSNVAELLERKRTLLDRMQKQSEPERLAETQHELQEIDESLNRIEADTRLKSRGLPNRSPRHERFKLGRLRMSARRSSQLKKSESGRAAFPPSIRASRGITITLVA